MILDAISTVANRFLEKRSIPPIDARIWGEMGWIPETTSGITINAATSMKIATVFACIRLLSDTLAQLPLNVMRAKRDGTNDIANDTPIGIVLRNQPNQWQTSFEWRQMMMGHVCLRGNAYSAIIAGPLGAVTQLIPLHPERMAVKRIENGNLIYKYTSQEGVTETYAQAEIFHLRGLSSDGITGLSPIHLCRNAVGLAAAMETHGASLFKNSARPAAIIKHPGHLTEPAAAKLRERWERIHGGTDNAGKTAVLEEGMTVETIGMSSEDAQYIESRNFQGSEIARIFGVPLHMLADLSRATMNNIEHLSIEFVKFTMGPWLRLWEEAMKRDLFVEPALFPKFNVNGLLRGDSAARSQFYQTMFQIGAFSPNDIRDYEDMDPVEGGDQRFVPLNMVPLDMASDKAATSMSQPEPAAGSNGQLKPQPQAESNGQPKAESKRRMVFWHDEAGKASLRCGRLEAQIELLGHTLSSEKTEKEQARDAAAKAVRSLNEAKQHCFVILTDSASRMIQWEIGQVQRAAKKKNFLKELDDFYSEHQPRFISAMLCACDLYRSLTQSEIPCEKIVARHIEQSRATLLDIAGRCTQETIADEIAKTVANWTDRASAWIQHKEVTYASSNAE
jgi:HK97 family phage portal protein